MTTKRKRTKAICQEGINYLKTIVESNNCIFQEIDLNNDVGNDAYIEFIINEESTSFCIAIQVKSGKSNKRKEHYSLKADKDHFEYWHNHNLPICGVVFNTEDSVAVWTDITHYLTVNNQIIQSGPFSIPIQKSNILNKDNFMDFVNYYLKYQVSYRSDTNFCKSLDYFSSINNETLINDGAKSLFYNHRNRQITWFVLINSFSNVDKSILKQLTYILCHVPGHGDIWWSEKNIIDESIRNFARSLIKSSFNKTEITRLLSIVDENGFGRGSIGQCIESVISLVNYKNQILNDIVFDQSIDEYIRINGLFLLLYYLQEDKPHCIEITNKYIQDNTYSQYMEIVHLLTEQIEEDNGIYID